jgi:hypothetical protein
VAGPKATAVWLKMAGLKAAALVVAVVPLLSALVMLRGLDSVGPVAEFALLKQFTA